MTFTAWVWRDAGAAGLVEAGVGLQAAAAPPVGNNNATAIIPPEIA